MLIGIPQLEVKCQSLWVKDLTFVVDDIVMSLPQEVIISNVEPVLCWHRLW